MLTKKIDSLDALQSEFNNLGNSFVYRGQANSDWPLTSSLERLIGSTSDARRGKQFEEYSLGEFESRFHLYDSDNSKPDTKLSWLAAMQHYGVPTRLLDFTSSPYVALYFAIETYSLATKADFSVYALDYSAAMDRSFKILTDEVPNFHDSRLSHRGQQDRVFEQTVDPQSRNVVWVTEPAVLNRRLDRQAGCFVLSGNREQPVTDLLNSESYGGVEFVHYRFAAELYEKVFGLLRKVNLTSRTVYGDLDGLGRSIRMDLQAYV